MTKDMKFPELKIIDRIPNTNKNADSKEFLVVELDWAEIDNHKIESRKSWYKKYGVPNATKEQEIALNQLLKEVDWKGNHLYPSKYQFIFDKYSKFNITQHYYDECLHLRKMAIDEWNRQRPFDTNVREGLLEASIKFVELFFYMVVDAIYIYNKELHSMPVPPNLPNGDISNDIYFEHSVLLKTLMLYRFWKFQTGGALLVDKASNFVKNYNDSVRLRFDKEVKQDLIDNLRFEPLGIQQSYPEREEQLLVLVNQRVRDNKLNGILDYK